MVSSAGIEPAFETPAIAGAASAGAVGGLRSPPAAAAGR